MVSSPESYNWERLRNSMADLTAQLEVSDAEVEQELDNLPVAFLDRRTAEQIARVAIHLDQCADDDDTIFRERIRQEILDPCEATDAEIELALDALPAAPLDRQLAEEFAATAIGERIDMTEQRVQEQIVKAFASQPDVGDTRTEQRLETDVRPIHAKHIGMKSVESSCSSFESICKSVDQLFRAKSSAAITHAIHEIYGWNARAVEWYGASSGWVFRIRPDNVLASIPQAVFNSKRRKVEMRVDENGIVPYVYRNGRGFLANDVSIVPFYNEIIEGTRSELAVPIVGPGDEILGVYNLESDQLGSFTPAQVREIQKKTCYFVPHLLVLKLLDEPDDLKRWIWHPQIEDWTVAKMLTDFCRHVAGLLSVGDEPSPSCTVWHADFSRERYWTIATTGYDSDFLNLYSLRSDSVVGQVAKGRKRTTFSGRPDELGFACLAKAQRMRVKHATIVSLHDVDDEPVCGTFNIYFHDDRANLPSHEVIEYLAHCVETIIASFNSRCRQFARAHLQSMLVRGASTTPDFEILRMVTLKVLRAHAMSTFGRVAASSDLECVDTTGLEETTDPATAKYNLEQHKRSLTCRIARSPDHVVRMNWGIAGESGSNLQEAPSNRFRETMAFDNPYHRRFLGSGVYLGDKTAPDLLGVIRVLRSSRGRPFTEADEVILRTLVDESKQLFVNWSFSKKDKQAPSFFGPSQMRIEEVLQTCVSALDEQLEYPVLQACVFVRADDSVPEFRLYAYHSRQHQVPPDESLAPTAEDLCNTSNGKYSDRIVVVPYRQPGGEISSRVYVPVMVWSGAHLVEGLFAVDVSGVEHTWTEQFKARVLRSAITLSAVWSANNWRPDRLLLEGGPEELMQNYLQQFQQQQVRRTQLDLTGWPGVNSCERGTFNINDQALTRYGVHLDDDKSRCLIPLMLGPFRVANLECELAPDLTESLAYAMRRQSGVEHSREEQTNSITTVWMLREIVGMASGAWARLVAGNLNLATWDVDFEEEQLASGACVWNEHVAVKQSQVKSTMVELTRGLDS